MRNILVEVLKQASPFPILKVVGTDKDTSFFASSECKTFIFRGTLKDPIPEFKGEFGISNIALLNGLLNFSSYNTDTATFAVKRRTIGDKEIVEQLEFGAGKRSGAVFRLTSPDLIGDTVTTMTGKPTWDVEFVPDKAKVAEFQQLATLHSTVSKTFNPVTDGGDLVFHVGTQNSSSHSARMVFQDGLTSEITGDLQYPVAMLMSAIKLAGANPYRMSFKSRSGPMKIGIESEFADYEYIIRASR